ncbi:triose-phosphate isomerase [Buchnera aphidicola]|uniref:Triosephosphate isomerase n=1 Tax=Buchnera aphidicola (Sarucallis kahawaluokalani) TaxID=1241878 RepID=A0A4D6YCZ5_9GAMM|nr:triose-phosphate isomerase [Buchnera aphidicola]QCI26003.1 triose-phosphate isomerase [Buchnera aphidicola (Sarucallis kahawaluokalani)]
MKRFIITANWKLNGNNFLINNFIQNIKNYLSKNIITNTIIFAPPIPYINNIKDQIKNKHFFLGAQNVDTNLFGAFTGEISINMLQDINVQYVIIGHSERRLFHNESNEYIAKKFQIIKSKNMIPILCIGENIQEKSSKKSEIVCQKQLDVILKLSDENIFKNSIIAYEPVWAIGTGKTADIQYICKMHQFIKKYITENSNVHTNEIIIQYGGSVNLSNIQNFLNIDEINGVLLGNSSLNYNQFIKIIEIVNQTYNK